MKNKVQSFVTYIRNGKEITKNITNWNRGFLFEMIGYQINERFGKYAFKEDIEYIYLKNVTFPCINSTKIKLAPHQILVLDNCIFKGYKIKIYQGNVEIIHPIFDFGYVTKIETCNVTDLNLILDKNIDRKEFLCLDLDARNIELNTNFSQYLSEIRIKYAESVLLKNVVEVIKLLFVEAYQNIRFEQSHIISYQNIVLETEQLYLENSIIETKRKNLNSRNASYFRIDVWIDVSNIDGDNYQLISENSIILKNSIYTKQETQDNIILTKDNLRKESNFENRRKLISVLKGIQKKYQLMYEEYGNTVKRNIIVQLENQPMVNHFPTLLKSHVKRKKIKENLYESKRNDNVY